MFRSSSISTTAPKLMRNNRGRANHRSIHSVRQCNNNGAHRNSHPHRQLRGASSIVNISRRTMRRAQNGTVHRRHQRTRNSVHAIGHANVHRRATGVTGRTPNVRLPQYPRTLSGGRVTNRHHRHTGRGAVTATGHRPHSGNSDTRQFGIKGKPGRSTPHHHRHHRRRHKRGLTRAQAEYLMAHGRRYGRRHRRSGRNGHHLLGTHRRHHYRRHQRHRRRQSLRFYGRTQRTAIYRPVAPCEAHYQREDQPKTPYERSHHRAS